MDTPGTDDSLTPSRHRKCWMIFANPCDVAELLFNELDSRQTAYIRVSSGETCDKISENHYQVRRDEQEDMQWLFADVRHIEFNVILYLWSLHSEPEMPDSGYRFPVSDQCIPVLHLIQAMVQNGIANKDVSLGIITCGSQIVNSGEKITSLSCSPLWGLGMLAENEYARITCKLVDLDDGQSAGNARFLADEFLYEDTDKDVAFREGKRFVKELARTPLMPEADVEEEIQTISTSESAVVLEQQKNNLVYRKTEPRAPGPGEIEVQVHYAALNFKDVLKVMGGLSPGLIEEFYSGDRLGMEISGTVTAVGEDAGEYKTGDEIVALVRGGFSSCATVKPLIINAQQYKHGISLLSLPDCITVPKPASLDFMQAPVFIGYLTAYYGLIRIAGIQEGETVLIHNASGGVGLAAVQVARWAGAKIFATAGNEEKREFLKSLGIEHVMNSRSLAFAEEVKKLTHGRGVDVVINAVAGETLYKSFDILAPFGRFIEIGKRDIVENNGLPMSAFNRNVIFASVDADLLFSERPETVKNILLKIGKLFDEGHFQPMPVKVFPAAEISRAFRFMAQSLHIGKIVVQMKDQDVPVIPEPCEESIFSGEGTWLITGGTSGLGLEIAKWLSLKGVSHLLIVSRGGIRTKDAESAIAETEENGTLVRAAAADIADEDQAEQMLVPEKSHFFVCRDIIR